MTGFFNIGTTLPVSENRPVKEGSMGSNALADYLRNVLPDRHAQFADAYAAAAAQHPNSFLSTQEFALLHAGLIDRESFYKNGGWALRPHNAGGTGDHTPRWVPANDIPAWATELGLLTGNSRDDGDGGLEIEVNPPAYAGAEVAGWGYGLGQIDFVSHRDWLDSHDYKDPFANLNESAEILVAGIEYLGDIRLGVCAYNAGTEHHWGSADPDRFTSGRDYSRDVITRAGNFGLTAVTIA